MKTFRILLTIACVLLVAVVHGQNDPLYNQYQFNQLLINPAYTGVGDRLTASWLTRLQWLGIQGAPVSNTATVQTSIKATNMGLGLIILNDRLGVNNNNEINVTYSYRLNFRNTKLQFGLQGGVVNFNYDYTKLNLEYLDDPNLQTQQSKYTKPNVGTGVFYYGQDFFVGLSIPRLMDVKVNDGMVGSVRYRRSEYLSAGYLFRFGEQFILKPSVLLKHTESAPFSYDINVNALLSKALWVGLSLRDQSAIGLNTMVQVNDRFRFGYAYEYPFNPNGFGSYGTHEFMIAIDFVAFSNQVLTPRYY